jgi:hypothetical protein
MGFAGCEYRAVIPKSIGGAFCMSFGTTADAEIVDYLIEALVFDTNKYEFRKYGRKI